MEAIPEAQSLEEANEVEEWETVRTRENTAPAHLWEKGRQLLREKQRLLTKHKGQSNGL